MTEDESIENAFEEFGLETSEKRNSFLKFDYQEVTPDFSKYLKVTTVTSKQQ